MDHSAKKWLVLDEEKNGGRPVVDRSLHELVGASAADDAILVSVIGTARLGKSTMLNCWRHPQPPAFRTSNHVASCTRGVDVAPCLQDISVDDKSCEVALLDCEGTGHAGAEVDRMLLLPVLLLSKVVVLNVRNLAPDRMLTELDDLVALGRSVHGKARRHHACLFGHLVIAVRDCTLRGDLQAKLLGQEDTSKLQGRRLEAAQRRNASRRVLMETFSSIVVSKVWAPADPARPHKDRAFVGALQAVWGHVRHRAMQPPNRREKSLRTLESGRPVSFAQLHDNIRRVLRCCAEGNRLSVLPALRDRMLQVAEHRRRQEAAARARQAKEEAARLQRQAQAAREREAAARRAAAEEERKRRAHAEAQLQRQREAEAKRAEEQRQERERLAELRRQQEEKDREERERLEELRREQRRMQQLQEQQQLMFMFGGGGGFIMGGGGFGGGGGGFFIPGGAYVTYG